MILWLLACTGAEKDTAEKAFFSPTEVGPYSVMSLEVTMRNSEGQEGPLQVWFPAIDTKEELYLYDDIISGEAHEKGTAACGEIREVVMFSHGNQGIRYQSYFLTEYLASHGYVVAAPRHVNNSFFDYSNEAMPEMIFRRPLDIQSAFDHLYSLNQLEGCLDEERGYAVVGHSFGGYTTVALSGSVVDTSASAEYCSETGASPWLCDEVATYAAAQGSGVYDLSDDRIWAGIPMAPAGYEVLIGGLNQVDIAMMVLGGEKDTSTTMTDQVEPIFFGMSEANAHLGTLLGANHYSFSNACDILPTGDYCLEDGLENTEAHQLINTLVVAFLGLEKGEDRMQEFLPVESDILLWQP